ncbi:MAG: DUF2905 domain-containing protein [Nanoarchaeota archaeon]
MNDIAKILIIGGFVLVAVGLFWQFGSKYLPLGKLPGDISIEKENFKLYFPITTSIVISLILSKTNSTTASA